MGLKIYVKGWWGGYEKSSFCFSYKSYRNRKSQEIKGYLEVILRVLEMIFGTGGGVPQIGLNSFSLK